MFLYIKDGRSFGPISGADLLELMEAGVLGPDDLARPEHEREWMKVAVLARGVLSGLYPSQPPPEPKVGSIPAASQRVFTSAPPIPPPRPVGVEGFPLADQTGCEACGTPAPLDANFCKRCGTALPRTPCDECGHKNDNDATFCAGCGRRLQAG